MIDLRAQRKVVYGSLATILIMAGTLSALELGVRLYSALFFPKMMVLDEYLGWRHAENRTKTFVNEEGQAIVIQQGGDGLRIADRLATSLRSRRLLVLGDSFTEAVHVRDEELFTTLLDRGIAGVEVLNAGVGGYGTVQEYLYLETTGFALRPDAVLLMFFDNDLSDNCLSYSPGFGPRPFARLVGRTVEIERDPDPRQFERFILPLPFRVALNEHCYLYNFANNRIYQQVYGDRMRALVKADMETVEASCPQFEILGGLLDLMRAQLDRAGIPLLIGMIPEKSAVETGESPKHAKILDDCDRRNLDCLSLLDDFHRAPNRSSLYFRNDIHWTAEGHRLAAAILRPRVEDMLRTTRAPR